MKRLLLSLFIFSLFLSTAFAQEDDCVVSDFPYSIKLDDAEVPALPACTSSFNAGIGNNWSTSSEQGDFEFDSNTLRYNYSTVEAANAWFFTNGFLLEEGNSYKISYTYASHNSYFTERLKVSYGKSANLSSMTRELADHRFNSKETEEHIIEIESTDVYYFGFLAHSLANQYYIYLGEITVELVNGASEDNPCLVTNLPYELEVSSEDLFSLPECTSAENLGEGNQWAVSAYFGDNEQMGSHTITYIYSFPVAPADSWFYTHPIQLEAGVDYELSYKYEGSANWPEKMKVAVGTENNHESMTQILADHNNINSYDDNQVVFQVTEDGVYYVGYHAYSDANMNYLYLTDIRLDVSTSCSPVSDLNATQESEDSILLSWVAPDDTNNWEVKYGVAGFDPETTWVNIEVENTPEVSISDLELQETYDFYVRSACGDENSTWTGPLSFELEDLSTCEVPVNIEVIEEDYGEFETGEIYIDLIWTALNEEEAWEVQYGLAGFDQAIDGTLVEVSEDPEVRLEGLIGETEYDIYVRALCSEEKHSEWIKITHTTLPLANVSDHLFKSFTLHPNPATDILIIQSETEIKGLSIYNLLGQKLITISRVGTEVEIDLSSLQSGQYIIKADIEGHVNTFQLIKR